MVVGEEEQKKRVQRQLKEAAGAKESRARKRGDGWGNLEKPGGVMGEGKGCCWGNIGVAVAGEREEPTSRVTTGEAPKAPASSGCCSRRGDSSLVPHSRVSM